MKTWHRISLSVVTLCAMLALPGLARAQDEPEQPAGENAEAPDENPAGGQEDEGIGLTVEAGVSSMYVYRGLNLFQEKSQMDQRGMGTLGVTYASGPLSVWYWGAAQINGDNISALIDEGTGLENDLAATYEISLTEELALALGAGYYFYPMATKEASGVTFPSYIEPSVALGWSGPVDASLTVSYYFGVQEAIGVRYIYLNPKVEKSIEFSDAVSLELAAGFGYKVPTLDTDLTDNRYDVLLAAAVPIDLAGIVNVSPSVSGAWTDLDGKSFSDEIAVFGGVVVGKDF